LTLSLLQLLKDIDSVQKIIDWWRQPLYMEKCFKAPKM
jgi:hypothetical protein